MTGPERSWLFRFVEAVMPYVYKYKKGRVWYLRYARHTGRRRKCLHTGDAKTAESIRVKEEVALAQAREGLTVREVKRIPFSRLVDEYLEHCRAKDRRPATMWNYRKALERFGESIEGDPAVDAITAEMIERHQLKMLRQGFARKTVRNEIMALVTAFRWAAVRRDYMREDVTRRLDLPKPVRYAPRPMRPEEYVALQAAIDDEKFKDYVHFSFLTGCRRGEAIILRFTEHVDFGRRIMVIPQPKQGTYRYHPITDELLPILERLKLRAGGSDLLIPLNKWDLSKKFRTYADKAGLPNQITWHSLRHTYGTNLAMLGVPQRGIQRLMGHSDPRSTEVYTGVWEGEIWRYLDRLKLPAASGN